MTRKKILFLIIYAVLAAAIGYFIFVYEKKESSETYDNIIEVNYSEIKEMLKERKTFALLVTQDGCSHCENFYPVVGKVSNEYKIKIYNLNLTNMTQEDKAAFSAIASISGTPTTIFYENGEEITTLNRINGETSKEALVSRLEKTGIIKKVK